MYHSGAIQWNGIHHIAIVTRDLDVTLAFYENVLGMARIDTGTPAAGQGPRHVFVNIGGGDALHIWEHPDAELFSLPLGTWGFVPGLVQHISFQVADEHALHTIQAALRSAEYNPTDIFEQGPVRLLFFNDPDGNLLEAAYWVTQPTSLDH